MAVRFTQILKENLGYFPNLIFFHSFCFNFKNFTFYSYLFVWRGRYEKN